MNIHTARFPARSCASPSPAARPLRLLLALSLPWLTAILPSAAMAQEHTHAAATDSGNTLTVEVASPTGGPATLKPGQPAALLTTIRDKAGKVLKDFDIVHERPLHLIIVSSDLSSFAHEHPEPQKGAGKDGTFRLEWTFPAAGQYSLFHSYRPKGGRDQVSRATVSVSGEAPAAVSLALDADKPKVVDGYTVTVKGADALLAGAPAKLTYSIMRDGKPVTDLQPDLGALGHLILISSDLKSFTHAHPDGDGKPVNTHCPIMGNEVDESSPTVTHKGKVVGFCCPGCDKKFAAKTDAEKDSLLAKVTPAGAAKAGPEVPFTTEFAAPGLYKTWAQFRHNDRVITVPFVIRVGGVQAGKRSTTPGPGTDTPDAR